MQELPTIKTNFLYEKSQDFNQTTHILNISLYFNCISSVKYVFKWSCHGHLLPFSAVRPKWFNVPTKKNSVHLVGRREKCLCIVPNASFLLFLHSKMVAYEGGYEGSSKKSYSQVFHMLHHFPIF